jgi:hypothetical protein
VPGLVDGPAWEAWTDDIRWVVCSWLRCGAGISVEAAGVSATAAARRASRLGRTCDGRADGHDEVCIQDRWNCQARRDAASTSDLGLAFPRPTRSDLRKHFISQWTVKVCRQLRKISGQGKVAGHAIRRAGSLAIHLIGRTLTELGRSLSIKLRSLSIATQLTFGVMVLGAHHWSSNRDILRRENVR